MSVFVGVQSVDGCQDLSNGCIKCGRNFLVHLSGLVKRSCQRFVFDDGDLMLLGHFLDLGSDQELPFGNDFGGPHGFRVIFEGHGKMGGVGDHEFVSNSTSSKNHATLFLW